jgi:hypothetical protein
MIELEQEIENLRRLVQRETNRDLVTSPERAASMKTNEIKTPT